MVSADAHIAGAAAVPCLESCAATVKLKSGGNARAYLAYRKRTMRNIAGKCERWSYDLGSGFCGKRCDAESKCQDKE